MLHRKQPRITLYAPDALSFSIPLRYIDVMRRTYTDIDSAAQNLLDDYWCDSGAKELSGPWMGKQSSTSYALLLLQAMLGSKVV